MTILSAPPALKPWREVQIDFTRLRHFGIDKPTVEFEKAHTYPASKPNYQPRTPNHLFNGFRLPTGRSMWGYVHVPFCNYACKFCFYAKHVGKSRDSLVDHYLTNLAREMDFALERLGLDAFSVKDFYVGGGTPTALNEEQLARFLEILRPRFRFEEDALASVEGSPESLTAGKIALLRDFGFSRFSLGLQSAEQRFLDASERKHQVEQAFDAYELLRSEGIDHVNVDLIYGFPGESVSDWEESLSMVIDRIQPESFTLYYLRYVPGTPFTRGIPGQQRATWEQLVEMRKVYMDAMEASDYERCRPHFFRKPENRIRRYHGAPTLDHENYGAQIGFGPSAYSQLGRQVGRSATSLTPWFQQVEAAGFGTVEGRELTLEDRLVRRIAKDLCNRGSLRKEEFEAEFGRPPEHFYGGKLDTLTRLGLIKDTGSAVHLTRKGILVDEEIAYFLFP